MKEINETSLDNTKFSIGDWQINTDGSDLYLKGKRYERTFTKQDLKKTSCNSFVDVSYL